MATNGTSNSCMTNNTRSWNWDVSFAIESNGCACNMTYAIVILNRPINHPHNFMKNLWNNAALRITVDGGTVRWHTYISQMSEEAQNSLKAPDLITGDFDSLLPDILEIYKKKGCKVVHTPDQMYTDFTKALVTLSEHCAEHNVRVDHIVAIAQNSGRIDQILANIQTLYLARKKTLIDPNTGLYIMSDDSVSWLLTPGSHEISIPEQCLRHRRAWCSLVPVGDKCSSVTTTGLKWNLDNSPLAFGELVSTSNTFDGSSNVHVECSHPLLWSMKVPSLLVP